MGERIELPQTPKGTAEEQLRQMYSYLYRVAEMLNHNLSEIGSMDLTDEERQVMQAITAEAEGEQAAAYDWQGKESLKSLIIKTAAFVQSKLDVYRLNLLGEYVADGKFGKYVRNTSLSVDVTPTGIQQDFTFEEVVQGLKNYTVNAKNYIKTGLLRTVQSIPVYGVAIGKDVVTFSEDGTETYNDGNKVAELTADELSFYQSGSKVASYKGNRISFLIGGTEVFYIESGKIHSNIDLELSSGKKLIINTTNFKVDSSGNVEIIGSIKAGSTFAGTMSANCITSGTIDASVITVTNLNASNITSGTMSANKISGGSIDATNVTITNLNASNINTGTLDASVVTVKNIDASKINTGTLDASVVTVKNIDASKITTGTMSANKISGGSIDASNVTITNLNASNINTGTLDASVVTVKNIDASKITTGTMSANKISGGSIDATNVTITNLNASNITSGTMSANKISGGSIDASNVTITNLNASNITSGTMSANKISGGSIDATNVTITNLNASNITSGTMSASKINGGTLTLGGNNNANGTLVIQDASGTQIGKWDNNGISASAGTFSGQLSSATGTFKGNLEAADGTFKVDSTNKNIKAADWTFSSAGMTYDLGGIQVGKFAMGQNADRDHVSDLRNAIKINQNYLSVYTPSDILWTQGLNEIRIGYINSNEIGIVPISANMDLGGSTHPWYRIIGTNATIGTVYYGSLIQTSSREIKHDIQPMPDVGEKLDQLAPVTFVYDSDAKEKTRAGFIYEDTMPVMPEICTGDEGNKAINYVELIPMLVKEIQSLRQRVSDLERRMDNVHDSGNADE